MRDAADHGSQTTSWVLVRNSDNQPLAETFLKHVAEAINKDKYRAVPIGEWLGSLNKR